MARPTASIVIPTRGSSGRVSLRRRRWIDLALAGILERTEDFTPEIVLVVDNDTSLDYVEPWKTRLGDRLVVVETPPPFNFSLKINRGVEASKGELIVLYNDDASPIGKDWLALMADYAMQPDVGAVGAQLLYADGTIQHVGQAFSYGDVFHFDAGNAVPADPQDRNRIDRQVSGVTAACLMQRREIFEELGGLDEDLPVNFNDVDYCARIGLAGYRIIQCNAAQLYHYESKTRGNAVEPWEVIRIRETYGDLFAGPDPFTPDARVDHAIQRSFWMRARDKIRG